MIRKCNRPVGGEGCRQNSWVDSQGQYRQKGGGEFIWCEERDKKGIIALLRRDDESQIRQENNDVEDDGEEEDEVQIRAWLAGGIRL